MTPFNPRFYRAAELIHAELRKRNCLPPALPLPMRQWQQACKVVRSIELAYERNWEFAQRRREQQLVEQLDGLAQPLNALLRHVEDYRERRSPMPSSSELYRDLVALAEEFPELEIQKHERRLCISTEPIVLDDIYLGAFQIRLSWGDLTYRVRALDPHPAASNPETVHPHVNGQMLCEGDGQQAIRAALTSGRLHDFFLLVHQILQTYAPGRAYCELDVWEGEPCRDCSSIVSEDDRYCCTGCEQTLCCDCSRYCRRCDQTYCWSCCTTCDSCDELVCESCQEKCRQCSRQLCRHCLNEELCLECYENRETEIEEELEEELEPEAATTVAAVAPVHALGLEQTDLLPGSGHR
jgi:hypothetical protein